MVATRALTIKASDFTGQKLVTARNVAGDGTVGELVDTLIPRMGFVDAVDGEPLTYRARLEREGRHLNASERIADALREEDEIVLVPTIDAG